MRKKILVIYPISLLPTIMMSQKRALTQILALSKEHDVSIATLCKNENEVFLSKQYFKVRNIKFYPVKSVNWNDSFIMHKIKGLYYYISYLITGTRISYLKASNKKVIKDILNVLENNYNIVISHYWYSSLFFKFVKKDIFKIIDNHCLVEEDIELNNDNYYYTKNHWFERKYFKKSLNIQNKVFQFADMIVLNSKKTYHLAKKTYHNKEIYYCSNGQDLSYYTSYANNDYEMNTILFYGSMSGIQNIRAFQLFYNNVWPIIFGEKTNVKLLVVGNKPPEWIQNLNQKFNITVTGFVEDVRQYISEACCMIIPMDIGVGFRGRVIEVMAMGVPVIGNHNALDCIGIENEVNGFITDDYSLMAKYAIKLIQNPDLRENVSKNTRKFVNKNFSIESTFGQLSKHLAQL
ncbi:MAG: glycosyltransferase family 4 protein [Bacteroidales bacterium]|nr:glycosyltransferase family 4 protein [Bacteroidales bacterium]